MKEILLKEYEALKAEQLERIKTRDNLIYISLGVFGAIFSYAMFQIEADRSIALLVLPTLSLVLAWTYIVNDEKISQLGKYIREQLVEEIKNEAKSDQTNHIFGWESFHRDDDGRIPRKILQTAIDLMAFGLPPAVGIAMYYCLLPQELAKHSIMIIVLFVWGIIATVLTAYLLIFYDWSERFGKKKIVYQVLFWVCVVLVIGLTWWIC